MRCSDKISLKNGFEIAFEKAIKVKKINHAEGMSDRITHTKALLLKIKAVAIKSLRENLSNKPVVVTMRMLSRITDPAR
ncbi:hypothetical protein GCM10023261_15900 [Bartonella jaculi]|uniref:Uncharacterized protein n=1 Tax=Bartonella jaculi TaxID=686226 RepID=A0ABP9N816_9HYPH